jgi:hypothetical protein
VHQARGAKVFELGQTVKSKGPIPSSAATVIALSRLIVLPKERREDGVFNPRQISASPRLAKSKLAPSSASAPMISSAEFALMA